MVNSANAKSVGRIVADTFTKLGTRNARLDLADTVDIVRKGYCIGRRYELDGLRAIWFSDRDVIVFFTKDGSLLKSVSVSSRQAAMARQRHRADQHKDVAPIPPPP